MYRIEITADTLVELAGKVLSLAAQLNASAAPVPAAVAAPKAVKGATTATVTQVAPKPKPVAEPEPQPEPIREAAPEPVAEPEPQPEPVAEEPKAAPVEEFDFAREITPRVVAVVAKRGRGAMGEILEQFGVTKASHVPPERREELIRALEDAAA